MNTCESVIHSPGLAAAARPRMYFSTSATVSMSGTGRSNSYIAAAAACTWESISPGSTVLPSKSTRSVRGPASRSDLGAAANRHNPVAPHRHRFHDAEALVHRDDLPVMHHQVGLLRERRAADQAKPNQRANQQHDSLPSPVRRCMAIVQLSMALLQPRQAPHHDADSAGVLTVISVSFNGSQRGRLWYAYVDRKDK